MDNSETSTAEDDISEDEKNTRLFATQMLKSRIFLGHFQERRRVEPLKTYRDVIVISDSESELKKDVEVVRRRLRRFYGHDYWIGITEPEFIGAPRGYCFWVESEDHALGTYWYKIKGIRFRRNELIVRIKLLRAVTENDTINDTTRLQNQSIEEIVLRAVQNFSWETSYENLRKVLEYIAWLITTVLTPKNIKEAITYTSVLIATSIAVLLKSTPFLMNFTLKLMREMSYLIQSCTPVMLAVINLIGKCVGGFYLLIVMMWRDTNVLHPQRNYMPGSGYKAIDMPTRQQMYTRKPRSSVVIREID